MKTYYKKQDTIEGILYEGGDPTALFPDTAKLSYVHTEKSWYLKDERLRPGFYHLDGWGEWQWMHPEFFHTNFSAKAYQYTL